MVEAVAGTFLRGWRQPESAPIRQDRQDRLEQDFLGALQTQSWIRHEDEGYTCLKLKGKILKMYLTLIDFQSVVLEDYTEVVIGNDIWLRKELDGTKAKI